MRVFTIEQMRQLERASDESGHSYATMMERAGSAVASAVQAQLGDVADEAIRILVLVGPGNNGGDGLVAARELAKQGYGVVAYLWKRDEEEGLVSDAIRNNVSIAWADRDEDGHLLNRVQEGTAVIIDALFGTGISRPIQGKPKEILETVRKGRARTRLSDLHPINRLLPLWKDTQRPLLFAVDVPSGLNGDNGTVDESTVPADITITFVGPKIGMLTEEAADVVGTMVVADIGIPDKVLQRSESEASVLIPEEVAGLLPRRSNYGHKGTFGTVLVIGGSANYVGAPAMSALAAGRSGAGLVTVAAPLPIQPVLAARPDVTTVTWLLLPHDMGSIREEAVEVLAESLGTVDALVLGPGLGGEESARRFVWRLFDLGETVRGRSIGFVPSAAHRDRHTEEAVIEIPPTVIDADGLNALAAYEGAWWEKIKTRLILTPHPGEMGRLLARPTREIQADRTAAAREAAERFGQVVVLKGAHTVVAAPDGRIALAPFANDALAKAGTGDVLAGIIGGLLGQGMDPYAAATLAVVVHGLTGERLRDRLGRRGALASDLIDLLPEVWAQLEVIHSP